MRRAIMKGGCLIHIVVSVALVLILAGLLLPILGRTSRSSAPKITCASNLKQLGQACMLYAAVHDTFPRHPDGGLKSLGLLYRDYVASYQVFSCPSNPTLGPLANVKPTSQGPPVWPADLNRDNCNYGYDDRHGPEHPMAAIAADFKQTKGGPGPNSDNHGLNQGQYVLFGSGSVEFLPANLRPLGGGSNKVDDIFAAEPDLEPDQDSFIRQ